MHDSSWSIQPTSIHQDQVKSRRCPSLLSALEHFFQKITASGEREDFSSQRRKFATSNSSESSSWGDMLLDQALKASWLRHSSASSILLYKKLWKNNQDHMTFLIPKNAAFPIVSISSLATLLSTLSFYKIKRLMDKTKHGKITELPESCSKFMRYLLMIYMLVH